MPIKTIRMLPGQIPQIWDVVKFASVTADVVPENGRQVYLNKLLHNLLNDKCQCFIRFDDDRQLIALAITRLTVDPITGDKSLVIDCLFSFKQTPEEQWKSDIELIKSFARSSGCRRVVTQSSNQRIFDIVTSVGFSEQVRSFSMEL